MLKSSPRVAAVITGDIVDSSGLSREARQALPGLLKGAGKAARRVFPGAVPFDLQVFRGDSWQLLVANPALGLRTALFIRCAVIACSPAGKPLDTRAAIGIGSVDFLAPSRLVSEGDGPAFKLSGEGLDQLRQARMSLAGEGVSAELSVAVTLLDAVAQKWTARQALAVQHKLEGLTQMEIAARWPQRSSQQAIADQLRRARWSAVAELLELTENKLKAL